MLEFIFIFLIYAVALVFYPFSFEIGLIKITILQIGSFLIFGIWLIKKIKTESFPILKIPRYILLPSFLFLVSGIFSYFFITPYKSVTLEEL